MRLPSRARAGVSNYATHRGAMENIMWKLFRTNRPPPSVESRPPRGTSDTQGAESSATQSSPRIVLALDPDPSESTFVERCLLNYNLEQAGPHHYRKLAAFLRDPANQVLGSITGSTY
jgi:hypothetical protein